MQTLPTCPERIWRPGSLDGVHRVAEAIASKDLTNLYRTSCYFADLPRYQAFCAFYAVMRVVDDRVDALAAHGRLTETQREREITVLEAWRSAVADCLAGRAPRRIDAEDTEHPDAEALLEAVAAAGRKFPVPAYLWERFFMAMGRDLEHRRFHTYREFVNYADGAAVSPTTIYLFLIAAERDEEILAYRVPPVFALIRCGYELGLFAYLGHILSDLVEDLQADRNYLAADDMLAHGVTAESLRADLLARSAGPGLRALTRELSDRAGRLGRHGRARLHVLEETLSVDRAFVLELVIRIYEAVLEKIAGHSYDVMSGDHRLTETDKQAVVESVASEF